MVSKSPPALAVLSPAVLWPGRRRDPEQRRRQEVPGVQCACAGPWEFGFVAASGGGGETPKGLFNLSISLSASASKGTQSTPICGAVIFVACFNVGPLIAGTPHTHTHTHIHACIHESRSRSLFSSQLDGFGLGAQKAQMPQLECLAVRGATSARYEGCVFRQSCHQIQFAQTNHESLCAVKNRFVAIYSDLTRENDLTPG